MVTMGTALDRGIPSQLYFSHQSGGSVLKIVTRGRFYGVIYPFIWRRFSLKRAPLESWRSQLSTGARYFDGKYTHRNAAM